uniref:(northern house mosquito) hypothetical protein n=1 Tax=Culex pipiens TaxID=7175 RepID=A0A8D8G297_CULPI
MSIAGEGQPGQAGAGGRNGLSRYPRAPAGFVLAEVSPRICRQVSRRRTPSEHSDQQRRSDGLSEGPHRGRVRAAAWGEPSGTLPPHQPAPGSAQIVCPKSDRESVQYGASVRYHKPAGPEQRAVLQPGDGLLPEQAGQRAVYGGTGQAT